MTMCRSERNPSTSFLMLMIFINVIRELVGIKIIEIKVPPRAKTGDTVTLDCLFDLEGQTLYSLNWWLNNAQFYQFDPSEGKQQIIYETPGVQVDKSESNLRLVTLRNVTKSTSGEFKCEIVADFPSYERDSLTASMEVIDVPNSPPIISLEKPLYNIGDHLRANCTAQASNIQPMILWYLNGKKINFKHVTQMDPTSPRRKDDHSSHHSNRETKRHKRRRIKRFHASAIAVISHVSLELKKTHFAKDGRSILTCTAIYAGIFHMATKLDLTTSEVPSVKPSLRVSSASASRQELSSTLSLLVFWLLPLYVPALPYVPFLHSVPFLNNVPFIHLDCSE